METNYQQAFINIVKILFPRIKIDCVETKTFYKGDSYSTYYSCVGIDLMTNNLVQIETKDDSVKGSQICVEITDSTDGDVMEQYEIWSHSFNWKGLGIVNNVVELY